MSLRVEDARTGRSRSRSRSRRDSSPRRDEKHKRGPSAQIVVPEYDGGNPRSSAGALPYPSYSNQGSKASLVRPPSPPGADYYSRPSVDYSNVPYIMSGAAGPGPGPGYGSPPEPEPSQAGSSSVAESLAQFLPTKYSAQILGHSSDDDKKKRKKKDKKEKLEDDLAYGAYTPTGHEVAPVGDHDDDDDHSPNPGYAQYKPYEYAKAPEHISYQSDTAPPLPPRYGAHLGPENGFGYSDANKDEKRHRRQSSSRRDYKYSYDSSTVPPEAIDPRHSQQSVVTVEPGSSSISRVAREPSRERRRRDSSPGRKSSKRDSSAYRSRRESSPQPPTGKMSFLTVQTPHHSASLSLSSAPPSPLLESYQGTYQSMSPMPSPILGPQGDFPDVHGLYPPSPTGGRSDDSSDEDNPTSPSSPKRSRRARFHDPSDDALRIAKALSGDPPDVDPLLEILPGLTHEQVMELRNEYKRIVKTGADKKGVNVAKHIRSKLKDSDPHLMKACFATALGRWESEAYWANFWYQGDKTRRELLIESLFGRTNAEIEMIKDGFSDKKYANSLSRCMETELKEDKFKKCVMMCLKGERDEQWDRYDRPIPIDKDKVEDDVHELHRALKKGSESGIIRIVLARSDPHLKETLRLYDRTYKGNFAKDVIRKSTNLVGEVMAHVLNGVINRPLRDAMLVHQAVTLSRRDELRRELLTSRLVRFHWDREHMKAVKRAYRDRYGKDMREVVREATGGSDWGHFCEQLCISRTPGSVKRIERVEIIGESSSSSRR